MRRGDGSHLRLAPPLPDRDADWPDDVDVTARSRGWQSDGTRIDDDVRLPDWRMNSARQSADGFDWRTELELIAPDVTLPPACSAQVITAAEGSLGLTFPSQLVEFLRATDGVYDAELYHWFAWSLERIVDENFEPDRPRDLLLIGDDAASAWFCLPLAADRAADGVIHYERTTGQRQTIAPDVCWLWLGWFGGTISVGQH